MRGGKLNNLDQKRVWKSVCERVLFWRLFEYGRRCGRQWGWVWFNWCRLLAREHGASRVLKIASFEVKAGYAIHKRDNRAIQTCISNVLLNPGLRLQPFFPQAITSFVVRWVNPSFESNQSSTNSNQVSGFSPQIMHKSQERSLSVYHTFETRAKS